MDLLRSLADRFPQVILITHIESVRDGFDRIIRVDYDPVRASAVVRDEPLGRRPRCGGLIAACRGPDRATRRRHRAAQPALRGGVHRSLPARRHGRRAGAAPQPGDLALRHRGRRRGRDALARRGRRSSPRSTWCTSRAPRAGWGRSRCGPIGRASGLGRADRAGRRRPGCEQRGATDPRARDHAAHGREHRILQPARLPCPGHLTVTLVREPEPGAGAAGAPPALGRRIAAGSWPSAPSSRHALAPGIDFSRELALTRELGLGDTTMLTAGRPARWRSRSGTPRRWRRGDRATSCGC